jgi:uncharacterized protein YxjI
MEININQKKISIGDKYKIFIEDQEVYAASTKLFKLLSEINLFETGGGNPKMTMNKKWSWLKPGYDLTRWDGSLLEFRTVSFWKHHYQCQSGNDYYDVYGHKGRKYSVYKNDTQIAWWEKKRVTWFAGDNYKIIANSTCDRELLISFCLVIDNYFSDDHDGNTVTINIGSIGPQAKKFDPNWEPKS